LLGLRIVLLEQIKKRAQLQSWDVGPAPTRLHVLEEFEQGASLGRKTGSEGTVLDGAMQMLEMAEQGQQHLGVFPMDSGDATDLGEEWLYLRFQGGQIRRCNRRDT
jgi:hypothetical protein